MKNVRQSKIKYFDLWGLRKEKYKFLETHDIKNTKWEKLRLQEPYCFFIPKDFRQEENYNKFISLKEIFERFNAGIATGKDEVLVDFNRDSLIRKLSITDRNLFENSMKDYKVEDELINRWYRELKEKDLEFQIKTYSYRPFDKRFLVYNYRILQRARKDIMDNFLDKNLGLCTIKQFKLSNQKYFGFALPSENLTCRDLITNHTYVFPLFIYSNDDKNNLFGKKSVQQVNFSKKFWEKFKGTFIKTPDPWKIFYYIYAVLYSNNYRQKYNEFLRIDFPKIPFTKDEKLFYKIAKLGKELVDLHLLKSEKLNKLLAKFPVSTGNILTDGKIEKREYKLDEKRIYINDEQYFEEVKSEVWNYYIGGYQVLDKWLKDRINTKLSPKDVNHYLKVITAIKHTIDLQKEIDKIYPEIEKNLIN